MLLVIVTLTVWVTPTASPNVIVIRTSLVPDISNVGTINCCPVLTLPYSVCQTSVPSSKSPNSINSLSPVVGFSAQTIVLAPRPLVLLYITDVPTLFVPLTRLNLSVNILVSASSNSLSSPSNTLTPLYAPVPNVVLK